MERIYASEALGDLERRPVAREGWHLEDAEIVELADAVLCVLLEKLLEDLASLRREGLKEVGVLAAQPVRAVAPADSRAVPGSKYE